jgi:hypothetical protein
MSNPNNKFGYYSVGNHFFTYSQFEAQEYAARTNDSVNWHFNDEFFSGIDWHIEPQESLKELYAERAIQIRNKYDYIVLCFSGGSDSHNILSTFLENNIYIDEILTYHAYEALKDKHTPVANMVEITHAAVPEANKYIEKFPTTLHRLIDVSNIVKDYWATNLKDLKFNFVYYNNNYITPYNIVITNLPNILPEYKKLIESGKRVCFIHGTDKPQVEIDQGRWFFNFKSSMIDASFSIRRQIEQSPFDDEFFYWSPEAWKIIAKQAHVLKRYFQTNHYIVKNAIKGAYKNIDERFLSNILFFGNKIPMSYLKDAIYPYWDNNIVDVGKAPFNLYGIKSLWWTYSNLPGTKEHIAGVQHVAKIIGEDINSPKQITYKSPRYYF